MGCHRGRMGCRGAINYGFSFRSFPVTSNRTWQIGVTPSARHAEPPLLPISRFVSPVARTNNTHTRIRHIPPSPVGRPAAGSRLRWHPSFVSDASSSLDAYTLFPSCNCRALDVLTLEISHQMWIPDFWQRAKMVQCSPLMASVA